MIVFALHETATTDSKATPSYTVLSKQDSEVLLQPEIREVEKVIASM
jgi:hypothetical protein